jgi:hypothetical protein
MEPPVRGHRTSPGGTPRAPQSARRSDPRERSRLTRRITRLRSRHGENRELYRLGRTLLLLIAGVLLVSTSGLIDPLLHRGMETGAEEPFVRQNTGRELAINIDLTRFDPAQIDPVLATLQTSGFVYLRQPVSWAAMEPQPGELRWETLDRIVNGASARGMEIVALVQETPDWARRASELGYPDAPPSDHEALSTFLRALSGRYGDQIQFFQMFDRPNLAEQWGGSTPSATEYTELLAAAFGAIRETNAEAKIVLAELDPRGVSGTVGDDLQFIDRLYDVGAAAFFDVVAFQLDGGTRSPSDRTVSADRLNFSRAIALRELMIEQGDNAKAIWATRYGWNAGDEPSDSLAADYLLEGIERARTEWPWMGPLFAWSLVPVNEAWAPYALLNVDGTAKPQFSALASFGASQRAEIAPTGFAPMLSSAVAYDGTWQEQHLERQVFQTTSETGATVRLRFRGTGIDAIMRQSPDAGLVRATLDGKPLPGDFPVEDGASIIDLEWFQAADRRATLATGLEDGEHELVLTLSSEGRLTIGGLIVTRRQPMVWPIIVLTVAGIVLLVAGFRDLIYLVAGRWGHLNRPVNTRIGPVWGQFSERWAGRWPAS